MSSCTTYPNTINNKICTSSCTWYGKTKSGYYWCSTEPYTFNGKTYDWDYCNPITSPTQSELGHCCTTSCKDRDALSERRPTCWTSPYTYNNKKYNWDYCVPHTPPSDSETLPECECKDRWTYIKYNDRPNRYTLYDIKGCWDEMYLDRWGWVQITRERNKKDYCIAKEKCKDSEEEPWPTFRPNDSILKETYTYKGLHPDNILYQKSYNEALSGKPRHMYKCRK